MEVLLTLDVMMGCALCTREKMGKWSEKKCNSQPQRLLPPFDPLALHWLLCRLPYIRPYVILVGSHSLCLLCTTCFRILEIIRSCDFYKTF